MKQYIIAGALALVLILLIVATTWITLDTFSIGDISLLSISDMQAKKQELEVETANLITVTSTFDLSKTNLEDAQDKYKEVRDEYNSISQSDIETIKEATKEDHYYVEWLWIVLGEYAEDNNLELNVIDPRKGTEESAQGTLQIKLLGRYQDIANFVFEVENDAELKFKLDNMVMQYSSNNKVSATFDVLSMEVLF